MARLAKEKVEQRELFMRGFMEKQKQAGHTTTLDAANEALVSHFGKGTPKMSSGKVYEIRDSIYGKGSVKRGAPKKAAKATTAKRAGGQAPEIATNGGGSGATGLFVLKGDVQRLLAIANSAGVTVALDEAATQAVAALRASA